MHTPYFIVVLAGFPAFSSLPAFPFRVVGTQRGQRSTRIPARSHGHTAFHLPYHWGHPLKAVAATSRHALRGARHAFANATPALPGLSVPRWCAPLCVVVRCWVLPPRCIMPSVEALFNTELPNADDYVRLAQPQLPSHLQPPCHTPPAYTHSTPSSALVPARKHCVQSMLMTAPC